MDDVVRSGLAMHLDAVAARRAAGAERLGWKVAFNGAAIQRRLGLDGSLVAALDRRTVLVPPARYSMGSESPVAMEAEVGVLLSATVDPGGDAEGAARCVGAWGPAIEIVHLDRPFEQLEQIVEEGVFHRAVAFGARVSVEGAPALAGVSARVTLDGTVVCEVDAGAATGGVGEVLRHVARLLQPFGQHLAAGDTVILGAMNPLTMARAGQRFALSLGAFDEAAVDLVV